MCTPPTDVIGGVEDNAGCVGVTDRGVLLQVDEEEDDEESNVTVELGGSEAGR